MIPFEDLVFLFNCDIGNRGIVRLDFNEAALLYKYVKKCNSSVLEIGRMFGGSAILMAAALGNGQMVYTVDMNNTDESIENISTASIEIKDKINVITGLSVDIAKEWQKELSLVFLDGGHSYSVRDADCEIWSPFVELNGYIVFHDIRGSGAYLGLEPILQKMKDGKSWEEIDSVGSMVVLQRLI